MYNTFAKHNLRTDFDFLIFSESNTSMTLEVAGFLTAWDKLGIMALGGAFVGLTVLVVLCAVGPGCCLYRLWNGSGNSK